MRTSLLVISIFISGLLHAQQYHFSLSGLFEIEEVAYFDPPNAYSALEGGLMIKAAGVYGESIFRYGWFVDYIPTNYVFRYDFDLAMVSFGGIVGAAFNASDDIEIQGLIELGYRLSNPDTDGDAFNGLALNLNINGIYWLDGNFHPKLNFGFQTQPAGGNEDITFTYSPQWYVGVGVVFSDR